MIALGQRFSEEGGDTTYVAQAQVFALAAFLMGRLDEAKKLLDEAGVNVDSALSLLGTKRDLKPREKGDVATPNSLFSMLVKSKTKKE